MSAMHSHSRSSAARPPSGWLLALAVGAAGALAVLALLLVRGMTYRGAVAWSDALPAGAKTFFDQASENGIYLLMVLFAAAVLIARRRGLERLALGIAAGVGVVASYASSELIKVLVGELRPCRNFDVATIAACPEAADWSWPSNHATISVAVALAVLAMSPRLGLLAVPLAGLIAFSRVAVGVHYFHDVLAGALLATFVVIVVSRYGGPPVERMLRWSCRLPILDRVMTGTAHGTGGDRAQALSAERVRRVGVSLSAPVPFESWRDRSGR